jgi:hypothetical protein
MAVTRKPPLSPVNASRSEMDAYARKAGGLTSTGPNMGAATRNRATPPTTVAPQAPVGPGTAPANGNVQPTGPVPTPSGPVAVVSVLDVGAAKVGDQISFSVMSIQNGQVQLGNPLVLPGTPASATTGASGGLQ